MVSGGLSLGHSVTTSFIACMDRQLQDGLLATGRRPLVGLDAACLCGTSLSSRADPLLLLGCASGLHGTVAVSRVTGGLLDISFAGAPAPRRSLDWEGMDAAGVMVMARRGAGCMPAP